MGRASSISLQITVNSAFMNRRKGVENFNKPLLDNLSGGPLIIYFEKKNFFYKVSP